MSPLVNVPNSLLDHLLQYEFSAREYRITMFLISEIIGYGLEKKIIPTSDIIEFTGIYQPVLGTAIRSLVKKGIIKRTHVPDVKGAFEYEFAKEFKQ